MAFHLPADNGFKVVEFFGKLFFILQGLGAVNFKLISKELILFLVENEG
jgi:hypothetical protein